MKRSLKSVALLAGGILLGVLAGLIFLWLSPPIRPEQMQAWAEYRVRQLEQEDLCGFIFKKDSPSSGLYRVKVYSEQGMPRNVGTGMFARAFMALDSHTYGFTMQELALPFDAAGAAGVAEEMAARVFADAYPNLLAMAELTMSGAQMLDFEFGLDLLLDGLERLRSEASRPAAT